MSSLKSLERRLLKDDVSLPLVLFLYGGTFFFLKDKSTLTCCSCMHTFVLACTHLPLLPARLYPSCTSSILTSSFSQKDKNIFIFFITCKSYSCLCHIDSFLSFFLSKRFPLFNLFCTGYLH